MNLRAVVAVVGLVVACGMQPAVAANKAQFELAPFHSLQSQYFNEVDDGTNLQLLFEHAPANAPDGLARWSIA